MARFPDHVAARLLAACKRHCCICLRWRGRKLEIHHIIPQAEDGPGTYENGIPVCFDCHAEIESKSNMGRGFTEDELRAHRDHWFDIVKNRPEVLLRDSARSIEVGPLEALLGELRYNFRGIPDDTSAQGFPPLEIRQFRRALGANALAALDDTSRSVVHETYAAIKMLNSYDDRMLNLRAADSDYRATQKARNQLAESLRDYTIPHAIRVLVSALGGDAAAP